MLSSVLPVLLLSMLVTSQQPPPPPPPPPPPIGGTCPTSCSCVNSSYVLCSGHKDIEELSFEGLRLNEVPVFKGSYPNLTTIDLTNNLIRRIREESFGSDRAITPRLQEIILKQNEIEHIERRAFSGSLVNIDLDSNRIVGFSLEPYSTVLPTLETLILRNNRIDRIDPLPTSFTITTFPYLTLDLSNNPIRCETSSFLRLCDFFIESFEETRAECRDNTASLAEACHMDNDDTTAVATVDNVSTTEEEEEDDTPTRDNGNPDGGSPLELIIGPAIGVPIAFIVLTVIFLVTMLSWRSKRWERKFQDVAEAQMEANLRLGRTLRVHDPKLNPDPRYATGPFTVANTTSSYNSPPFPGSSTVFFPPPPSTSQDNDDEDVYSSIDNRPLPAFPPVEVDYEDAYILRVDSVPQRNVLPGIAIAKRREEEAKRLSMYPAPNSKPRNPIPSTASDSETELEPDHPTTHTLHTGSDVDHSPTTSQHKLVLTTGELEDDHSPPTGEPEDKAETEGTQGPGGPASPTHGSQEGDMVNVDNSDIYLSLVQ